MTERTQIATKSIEMSPGVSEGDVRLRRNPAESGRQKWFEVGLVFLVFFVHAAEPVPDVNEAHYLLKAKHYWQPGWLAGDMFLESADAHLIFYWTFGWMTQWLPLAATAWVGRLLTWCLFAWAWQRLSAALVPCRFVSVLTAAIFVALTEQADLAGEWVVGGIEAKGFAYVLVLLGLERLVRRCWNTAWILFGAAAAFHVLVGGWSVVAATFAWTLGRPRTPLSSMLPGLLGGGALAVIGVWPGLALSQGQPAEAISAANVIYVFERLPHHLAILSQDPAQYRERMGRHGAAIVVFALLVILHGRLSRGIAEDLQFANLSRIRRFVLGALGITTCGLLIEVALQNNPELAAGLLRYYWYRLGDFAVPLGVAIFAGAVASRVLLVAPRLAAGILLLFIAFPAWYLADVTWQRLKNPAPRTERDDKTRDWADWIAVTSWVAENTPADAIFLTPRNNRTFKWRAIRAEVVTHKDIPQDARGILLWQRRIEDIHRYTDESGDDRNYKSLGHQGTPRILELSRAYGVDFVLTDTRRVLGLPIVYLNDSYVVYRVPPSE